MDQDQREIRRKAEDLRARTENREHYSDLPVLWRLAFDVLLVEGSLSDPWRTGTDSQEANRPMVQSVEKLDESLLDKQLTQVGRTHYTMLHGTIQHNVYHAGPISLLKRQLKSRNPD